MSARPLGARAGSPDGFALLMLALAGAAAVELLILRSFTRTAIHIPALQELSGPYRVISAIGRYDYFVAVVLLMGALPACALMLGRRCGLEGVVASVAVGLFSAAAFLSRQGAIGSEGIALVSTLSILTLASVLFVRNRRIGTVLLLYAAAFTLAALVPFARSQSTGSALWYSEILVVAAGLASPAALGVPLQRRIVVTVLAATGLSFAFILAGDASVRILMLWNQGVTGSLPPLAYAVAVGGLSGSLVGLFRQRRHLELLGLMLTVIAGIGLHSTYQTGLAVVGIAVLCCAVTTSADRQPALE